VRRLNDVCKEIRHVLHRAKRGAFLIKQEQNKRAKRIEWNNVSSVVDVAIMSVAISRVLIHREYSRLPQSSLASLAHLLVPAQVALQERVQGKDKKLVAPHEPGNEVDHNQLRVELDAATVGPQTLEYAFGQALRVVQKLNRRVESFGLLVGTLAILPLVLQFLPVVLLLLRSLLALLGSFGVLRRAKRGAILMKHERND